MFTFSLLIQLKCFDDGRGREMGVADRSACHCEDSTPGSRHNGGMVVDHEDQAMLELGLPARIDGSWLEHDDLETSRLKLLNGTG